MSPQLTHWQSKIVNTLYDKVQTSFLDHVLIQSVYVKGG